MEKSFHYYGTYCAACLAGYSHEESLEIGYCAQLVDHCAKTFLKRIDAPLSAATTQLTGEMTQMRFDVVRLMTSREYGRRSTSCPMTSMHKWTKEANGTATSTE